jgi:hypothetical protein
MYYINVGSTPKQIKIDSCSVNTIFNVGNNTILLSPTNAPVEQNTTTLNVGTSTVWKANTLYAWSVDGSLIETLPGIVPTLSLRTPTPYAQQDFIIVDGTLEPAVQIGSDSMYGLTVYAMEGIHQTNLPQYATLTFQITAGSDPPFFGTLYQVIYLGHSYIGYIGVPLILPIPFQGYGFDAQKTPGVLNTFLIYIAGLKIGSTYNF